MAAAPARSRPTGSPLPGELEPLTGAELHEWFRGGEQLADECEATLASLARVRGATDVAIAEGLDLLRRGDRLAALGCHLDDYAREVLDLGRRATEGLARLGRELRTRPLLR
ncbi:MAG TPA: HNH endonuclease, partial [Anaeromyxobacter sp.]